MGYDAVASDADHPLSGAAKRYALALFELANETGKRDVVLADLRRFNSLVAQSSDLQRLIKSPVFTGIESARALAAVLSKFGIDGICANLLTLVATKRRLFLVVQIIQAYEALMRKAKGITRAEIRLAAPASDAVLADIRNTLKPLSGGEVETNIVIDPSLIGGMVVRVDSKMIDSSLKTKLNSLRLAMKEA
jgi:F-type H+-transporting ATPase subunit delta